MSNDAEHSTGEPARPVAGAKRDARKPAVGATPPFSRRRPDKPFIPFVGFEDVMARCGHVEKFGLLPDNKDRFRQDRRKKAMGRDCRACREKRQLEQEEAARLRLAEKERRKTQEPQRRAGGEKATRPESGRLPDGSRFEVSYDATKERWSGTLTVPTDGGEPATFNGSGSGLVRMLSSLDKLYRATLK
jgi:hypothetical protein